MQMSEYLKCDAAGCDHVEDVDVIVAEMVGKPCPKCGANLLTAEDWNTWHERFVPVFNAMKVEGLIDPAAPSGPTVAIRVGFHDGGLSFTTKPA